MSEVIHHICIYICKYVRTYTVYFNMHNISTREVKKTKNAIIFLDHHFRQADMHFKKEREREKLKAYVFHLFCCTKEADIVTLLYSLTVYRYTT